MTLWAWSVKATRVARLTHVGSQDPTTGEAVQRIEQVPELTLIVTTDDETGARAIEVAKEVFTGQRAYSFPQGMNIQVEILQFRIVSVSLLGLAAHAPTGAEVQVTVPTAHTLQ